jgi:hypothetical protein
MFSVYLQTIIVFPIGLSTIIGGVGTVSITGINSLGMSIIETINGVIMANRDMTVIVITLVGIEVMDPAEDLTKAMAPIEVADPSEGLTKAMAPIEVMDPAEDLTKAMAPIEVTDLSEDLIKAMAPIKVMAVIMAINDKLYNPARVTK